MRLFTSFSVSTLLCLLATSVNADLDAPYGFNWGQSQAEVSRMGYLLFCDEGVPIAGCSASQGTLQDETKPTYWLSFDQDHGLQRIELTVTRIENSSAGAGARHGYSELKKAISLTLGEPESFEWAQEGLVEEPERFFDCISSTECGAWVSFWRPEGGGVAVLELKGTGTGGATIHIAFDSKMYKELIDKYKEGS